MSGGWRCARPARGRAACERGAVPLELALGLGVLVLPIAMLVAVFPGWAERTAMARVATQEAARVAALSDSAEGGAAAGVRMAEQIAANHDVAVADLLVNEVHVPVDAQGDPRRGGEVVARLQVRIPVPVMPLGGVRQPLRWTVSHRERIDDYRSLP